MTKIVARVRGRTGNFSGLRLKSFTRNRGPNTVENVSSCEATLEIKNRLGLHLRAASTLAETVKKFASTVTLSDGREGVNARSVTNLIMLGAAQGTKLKVKVEGPDAPAAMAAIKAIFEQRFGED
jgi:phosphotransferase system HPr (HPr) family protein